MCPSKQTELLHVVLFDERQHKPNETNAIQCERQESMVRDQKVQIFHTIDHHTIVVHQIFAVEKVIGRQQKVPRQTTEPWQTVDAIDLIANRNDFLETFHLHQQRCYHQCQWAAVNDQAKAQDHDECENATNDVVLPSMNENGCELQLDN